MTWAGESGPLNSGLMTFTSDGSPNELTGLDGQVVIWNSGIPSFINQASLTGINIVEPESRFIGATNSPTTTSIVDVLTQSMTFVITSGTWNIWYNGSLTHNTNGGDIFVSIYSDGVQIADSERRWERQAGFLIGSQHGAFSCVTELTVSSGTTIEGRWRTNTGTATILQRSILAMTTKPSGV